MISASGNRTPIYDFFSYLKNPVYSCIAIVNACTYFFKICRAVMKQRLIQI